MKFVLLTQPQHKFSTVTSNYIKTAQNHKLEKLNEIIKLNFFKLLDNEFPISEFENWIYEQDSLLEIELDKTVYFDLISFNYKHEKSLFQLKEKLKQTIDTKEFVIWKIRNLLQNIIDEKINLVIATRKLRDLYYETDEKLIPITLGVGYESEFEDVPIPSEYYQWEIDSLSEKLKKVDLYRNSIIQESKELLIELNNKNNCW